MKYYVLTATGKFLCGQEDSLTPPANSTEVPSAPPTVPYHTWNGSTWVADSIPDPANFVHAVCFDPSIPTFIGLYAKAFEFNLWDTAERQAFWVKMKAYHPEWTSQQIAATEALAVTHNMPLV